MLILFESSVGFSLFRVLDDDKLKLSNVENIYKEFDTQSKRSNLIQLHAFKPFKDMDEARDAAKCIGEGEKLHKTLSKFIKKNVIKNNLTDSIGVIDHKIGTLLKNKYSNLNFICNDSIIELHRGLREYFLDWLSEITDLDSIKCGAMNLGLSHVLSRHKIQFSAEKVDTMIIQAIALLDELDKEINIYAMRCKEWYGWHFPEMTKIVNENMPYCRIINTIGMRNNCLNCDLSDIIDSDTEIQLKNMSKISMGSDITQSDLNNINSLATQVLELTEYRNELYNYLRNRMIAIAPNLTLMVGELVGARLLSHAGSLINLAKYPASTVQILGAEKALFRALKTKSDTPKYGLIYHASFVNAATQINKAKIARTLACKTSLSARVDAFSHSTTNNNGQPEDIASTLWHKMEKRINFVEGHKVHIKNKTLAGNIYSKHEWGDDGNVGNVHDETQDFKVGKKRKNDETQVDEPKKKKRKIDTQENENENENKNEFDDKEKKEKKEKKKKKDKKKKKKKKKKDTKE